MKKFYYVALLALFVSCKSMPTKQVEAEQTDKKIVSYDAELSGFQYPYPTSTFSFESQFQKMQMTYMDVKPAGKSVKTVVLFHGKNFSGYYFEPIIKQLVGRGMRVIVPDQIGFGKSTKPNSYQYSFHVLAQNTKKLLESIGVENFTLVGHSMGGMVATRFALMYPESVQKLILVNAIGLEDYKVLTPFKGFDELYSGELENNEDKIRNYQIQFYYDGKWKEEYEPMIQPAIGWTNGPDKALIAKNAAMTSELIYTQPVVYEFKQLKMPTTIINGLRDKTAPGKAWAPKENQTLMGDYPRLSRKVTRMIPNGKLVALDGLGHMPFVEDFERFMKVFVPEL